MNRFPERFATAQVLAGGRSVSIAPNSFGGLHWRIETRRETGCLRPGRMDGSRYYVVEYGRDDYKKLTFDLLIYKMLIKEREDGST